MSSKQGEVASQDIDLMAERSGREIQEDGAVYNTADGIRMIAETIDPIDASAAFPNFAFYLSEDGVVGGAANFDAIGDYSATPTEFKITAQPGQKLRCNRVIVTIEDTGSIDSGGYGNNSNPLTNGITVECRITGEPTRVLTAQQNIRRTADWNSLCYDGQVADFGAGNSFFVARWTFTRDGSPIVLEEGDEIAFILNDNFGGGGGQGLVGHRFLIKGEILEG